MDKELSLALWNTRVEALAIGFKESLSRNLHLDVSMCAVKLYVCTVVKTGHSEDKEGHRPVSFKSVPLIDTFLQEHGYRFWELFFSLFIKMFSVQLDGPVQPQHFICEKQKTGTFFYTTVKNAFKMCNRYYRNFTVREWWKMAVKKETADNNRRKSSRSPFSEGNPRRARMSCYDRCSSPEFCSQ